MNLLHVIDRHDVVQRNFLVKVAGSPAKMYMLGSICSDLDNTD